MDHCRMRSPGVELSTKVARRIATAAALFVLATIVGRSSAAVLASGAATSGGTGATDASATAAAAEYLEPLQEPSHHIAPGGGGRRPLRDRSLVIGTPTGSNKYPFLVVVYWEGGRRDVPDPRSGNIWCHGTMVMSDIVLVPKYCWPDNGYVMVGDSSNSSFVQFRNLTSTDPFHGMVYHPGGFHALFRIEPVTFPGFYPATISKDPDGVFNGQEVTLVGYGTNYNFTSFPGEAYESVDVVIDSGEDGFDSVSLGFGPCVGDLGVPVLDQSKSLIGITVFPNCGTEREWSARVSHVADWIERNACALSDRKEDSSFCPPLVCPFDVRLLGYPWAYLPDGTGSVVGIRGFEPVRATQWPPPGTPLWRGTITNVTISATDAAGRTLDCEWHVRVAPLEPVGELLIDLPVGTNTTSGRFRPSTWAISGRVYKMSGRTSDRLRGSGSSTTATLRKGGIKYGGKPLKLTRDKQRGTVGVPSVPLRFGLDELSDVELHLEVFQNTGTNNGTYMVYGQVDE